MWTSQRSFQRASTPNRDCPASLTSDLGSMAGRKVGSSNFCRPEGIGNRYWRVRPAGRQQEQGAGRQSGPLWNANQLGECSG